jgi:hypothetical protein
MMLQLLRSWLLGLLGLGWACLCAAHPMPESRVWIDTTPGGLRLTLQLPLNRLEFGYGQSLADEPAKVLARHADGLANYLLLHVGARSGGVGWQALRPQLDVQGNDGAAELQAVLELRAPPGTDPRTTTLLYDAITHEVRTHRVQVYLRTDWAGGFAAQAPLLLGELNTATNSLPIALAQASGGASLWRLVKGGAQHIAEGTDHLMFLFLLVLVAPLAAQARRWSSTRPVRDAIQQIAWVVTAFTVGHSVTLALGSSGLLRPPATAVEMAVALSIAVAAVHAMRPLFANGELFMALGFGLVHGFAFSASLNGSGLSAWQHAQALLAFNVGIELMQLAVLFAVMPPLLVLAHASARGYAVLRFSLAATGFVVAVLWALERAGMPGIDSQPWTDVLTQAMPYAVGMLWLAALAVKLPGLRESRWRRASSTQPPASPRGDAASR